MPEQFAVAFSFAGEQRALVRRIALSVEAVLGFGSVFFDEWFEHYIAGDDGDLILQDIYENRSELVVVCVSARYGGKPWTKAEHRAIRARQMRLESASDDRARYRMLPIRVGEGDILGVPFNTITPDVRTRRAEDTADLIVERFRLLRGFVGEGDSVGSPDGKATEADSNTLPATSEVTIIIPVYNESAGIEQLVKRLKAEGYVGRYQILICDDGSGDNSYSLLQRYCTDLPAVSCMRLPFNSRKVGAISAMANAVTTPFTLTLDADAIVRELEPHALESIARMMFERGFSATCFRIIPEPENWLGRLQMVDYAIFTDSIRALLSVPVCLIGQGVLWRTDHLLAVLDKHSGAFDGDDLENTIIALCSGMKLHWERHAAVISTIPKRTIRGLIRQRAFSWDFGMFRVLFERRVLMMTGDSGAFYKNLLLIDCAAHPFRLMAIPVLLPGLFLWLFARDWHDTVTYEMYARSVVVSFRYGSLAILVIWLTSVVNSCACVRRIGATVKWATATAVYLMSPFVYVMYYPLLRARGDTVYEVAGSLMYWMVPGLLLTYAWWLMVTTLLLWRSLMPIQQKRRLISSLCLAPVYYFVLLVFARTLGLWKYLRLCIVSKVLRGD